MAKTTDDLAGVFRPHAHRGSGVSDHTPEARILVADDDAKIRRLLQVLLKAADFEVLIAPDGKTALEMLREDAPDLLLLDWMLPEMSGEEVCRRAREFSQVPIIMLTARAAEVDRITGLTLGADDYVLKPFLPGELVARIRAQLRRWRMSAEAATDMPSEKMEKAVAGDIEIDPDLHVASVHGVELDLTPIEFKLLQCLVEHAGKVLSRDRLLNMVWEDGFMDPGGVNVHIHRLRRKIEDDPAKPQRLVTIRGVGYRLSQ